MKRILLALGPLALIAACDDEPTVEQQTDDERSARGEVLGGTISDDMLPLDTRRSQSPSLTKSDDPESGQSEGSDGAASAEEPAETTEPEGEPVSENGPEDEDDNSEE